MIISIKGKMKGKWGGAKCMGVAFFFFFGRVSEKAPTKKVTFE